MFPYFGGKYSMGRFIASQLPKEITSYTEPFSGAFWVYLKSDLFLKEIDIAYNDKNPFMYNLFLCLQNPKKLLEDYMSSGVTPQDSKKFEEIRDKILNSTSIQYPDYTLAWNYVYILTQLFSGQVITKSVKMFNLKGKYKSKFQTFIDRLSEQEYVLKLGQITSVHNVDFQEIIKEKDSETSFFYVDPPYYNMEQSYYAFQDFSKEDHFRLANVLKQIKGKFLLSYYDFPELKEWFPNDKYTWIYKEVYKPSSSNHNKSSKGLEVLIKNY